MSTFLGFDWDLIELGGTISGVHGILKTCFQSHGWQVITDTSGTVPTVLDLIPPTSETIGNSDCRELVRIECGANYIQVRPVMERLTALPQVIALWPKTAGAVAAAITIGGATVTGATGSSGSTAAQNLRSLYEAIRTSSDANFTDWTWTYQKAAPQGANDTNDYIYGVRKTLAANITPTYGSNVNGSTIGDYAAAGIQTLALAPATSITSDLVSGFVYYLQVNARGFAIATKTNTAYFGPVHACYAEHVKAAAVLPTAGPINIQPSIIELYVGTDGAATSHTSTATTSHVWNIPSDTPHTVVNVASTSIFGIGNPFSKSSIRHCFQDSVCAASAYWTGVQVNLSCSNIWTSTNQVGDDFQVHRSSPIAETVYTANHANGGYFTAIIPIVEITDWYKFVGTASDESLLMVADTVSIATLDGDLASNATTIPVDSTSLFESVGCLCIESEIITYTGKTETSFTGCTRGCYGSAAAAHFDGDSITQGLWLMKVNGGALFCGTVKPS